VRKDDPELVVQPVEQQPQGCGVVARVRCVHDSECSHGTSGDSVPGW
jgi:hypothetical protein